MALIDEITNSIVLAKSYQSELTDILLQNQQNGCMYYKEQHQINDIENLVVSLENRIQGNTFDEDTITIYNCLLTSIYNYSSSSLPIDPNASIPNLIIDVTIIGNNQPNALTFSWDNLIDNGEEGRIRYENANIAGWTPIIVIGDVDKALLKFRDFTPLSTGGFELLSDGNIPALYEGQVGWIVGYEPYISS